MVARVDPISKPHEPYRNLLATTSALCLTASPGLSSVL
jgi:hypothetical protein